MPTEERYFDYKKGPLQKTGEDLILNPILNLYYRPKTLLVSTNLSFASANILFHHIG
jgi:hypothetical protein